MSDLRLLWLFLLMTVGGIVLEMLLAKIYYHSFRRKYREHHYRFSKYLFYLLFPFLSILIIIGFSTSTLGLLFLFFSILGSFFEWLIGISYHTIVGQRLWTYHRYSFGGYTSLLSVPLWGLGGIMAWLLIKVLVMF